MNLAKQLKDRVDPVVWRRLRDVSRFSMRWDLSPYLVGGMVRDIFMSKSLNKDCDVTICGGNVEPLALVLSKHWDAELVRYPAFLTYTLKFKDGSFLDLVTTREERYPSCAQLPVVRRSSLLNDLLRRDFKVNAMALALSGENWGELIDPLGGWLDLKAKVVRILHPKSFEDDPTRIFRAARFCARFSFSLEVGTKKGMEDAVENKFILKLSADRIRTELEKILQEKNPYAVFRLLRSWNLLEQIASTLHWNDDLKINSLLDVSDNLTLLLLGNKISDVSDFLEKYNFPKAMKENVLDKLKLIELLFNEKSIMKIPRKELDDREFCFFEQLIRLPLGRNLKIAWKQYQKWCASSPRINGEDLKKLGLKPGPIFKEILNSIAVEKFKGKIKTKDEEKKFAEKFL